MRLSREGFARGIVSWDGPPGLVVRTMTVTPEGEPTELSAHLSDPSGSLAMSPPHEERTVRVEAANAVGISQLPEIRWTYHDDQGVLTTVWRYEDKTRETLRNCLGYGCFHRLVVYTPHLDFNEDVAFWSQGTLIRLTTTFSALRIKRNAVIQEAKDDKADPMLHMSYSGPYITTGRFVEVIAGTIVSAEAFVDFDEKEGKKSAESRAHAGWALAVLTLGENAAGYEIAHSESILASPSKPLETSIDLQAHKPIAVSEVALDKLDRGLNKLSESGVSDHLETALNWHLTGVQRTNSRDSLLASFIGNEVIVREYAKSVELKAEAATVAQDPRFEELLQPLLDKHSGVAVQKLIERSQRNEPSITECFDRYAEDHGFEDIERTRFRRIRRMRNPAIHGNGGRVSDGDAREARSLLERILASELETKTDDHR